MYPLQCLSGKSSGDHAYPSPSSPLRTEPPPTTPSRFQTPTRPRPVEAQSHSLRHPRESMRMHHCTHATPTRHRSRLAQDSGIHCCWHRSYDFFISQRCLSVFLLGQRLLLPLLPLLLLLLLMMMTMMIMTTICASTATIFTYDSLPQCGNISRQGHCIRCSMCCIAVVKKVQAGLVRSRRQRYTCVCISTHPSSCAMMLLRDEAPDTKRREALFHSGAVDSTANSGESDDVDS